MSSANPQLRVVKVVEEGAFALYFNHCQLSTLGDTTRHWLNHRLFIFNIVA
jgi:hypothetical protein